ncbi:MAG: hypothetical protein ABIM60_04775, partial [candidate division WOR-3 bacterium]
KESKNSLCEIKKREVDNKNIQFFSFFPLNLKSSSLNPSRNINPANLYKLVIDKDTYHNFIIFLIRNSAVIEFKMVKDILILKNFWIER